MFFVSVCDYHDNLKQSVFSLLHGIITEERKAEYNSMSPDVSLHGIGNGTGEITSQCFEIFMLEYRYLSIFIMKCFLCECVTSLKTTCKLVRGTHLSI